MIKSTHAFTGVNCAHFLILLLQLFDFSNVIIHVLLSYSPRVYGRPMWCAVAGPQHFVLLDLPLMK